MQCVECILLSNIAFLSLFRLARHVQSVQRLNSTCYLGAALDILANPLIAPISERWSPRSFAPLTISEGELETLFEAARWAASSFNEQPWRFIIATRSEPSFNLLASCLVEANHWAVNAPVLFLSIAHRNFTKNGTENRHAWHDVGLAVGSISIQAAAMGLQLHQMAGFSPELARRHFSIPDDFDPVAMTALGRPGDPQQLPEELRTAEIAQRGRRPLKELVFSGTFGCPAPCATANSP